MQINYIWCKTYMFFEVEKIQPKHNLWTDAEHAWQSGLWQQTNNSKGKALSIITSFTWKNIKFATQCCFQFFLLLSFFVCLFCFKKRPVLNFSNQSQYSFLVEEKSGPSRQWIFQSTQNRNNNCSNCLHGYCMWAVWLGAFHTSITYAFQCLC